MWLTKKWWFLIVAVPIIGLCVKAGFWQLDRAHQKEDLIRALAGVSRRCSPVLKC